MSEPRRYDAYGKLLGPHDPLALATFVHHDDYDALTAREAQMRAEARKLRAALNAISELTAIAREIKPC